MLGISYFEILTDHQALVSMLNTKTLDEIENPRQQNMKEKLHQRFNFKFKWQAGKKMMISGALSRAPVEECMDVGSVSNCNDFDVTQKLIVHAIMNDDCEKVFGDQKLNNLLKKANADQDYVALRNVVNCGFPLKR